MMLKRPGSAVDGLGPLRQPHEHEDLAFACSTDLAIVTDTPPSHAPQGPCTNMLYVTY